MKIFIDDFKLLRIESTDYIHHIHINGYEIKWLKNELGNQYFTTHKPLILHEADHIYINFIRYPLEIGLVTLTKTFDQKFRYKGQLGATYQNHQTTFSVFSPVAKEMYVVIDGVSHQMAYKQPIWTTVVKGDLEGLAYYYKVRLVDQFKAVNDPYAKGSNLESDVVVDLNKTSLVNPLKREGKVSTSPLIYEGHVRALTHALDLESKGTYQALTFKSDQLSGMSVLEYVKDFGATHLQLLPVYDFEGVDDVDKTRQFNWGYNPSKYFCLDGWYSSHPNDPYDRIEGYKRVVNKAHEIGLGINMDVVFNHVYLYKDYPYDHLVPGYFYRHDQNQIMTDNSYCGNDIETRRFMVRKLIIDNLSYWAREFKVDGFRFDLMGLMDLKTMKDIEKALRKINPDIMLYGEGWVMDNQVEPKNRSNMDNASKMPTYAFFNDHFRDFFKGSLHGADRGFIMGHVHDKRMLENLLNGSPHRFKHKSQSINYVECHDNFTLNDRLLMVENDENIRNITQDFANQLIAISKGIIFYHSGQEFYGSKKGVENSYNASDDINQIIWKPQLTSLDRLKKLIKLRQKHDFYTNDHPYRFKQFKGYFKQITHDDYVHYLKYDFSENHIKLDGYQVIFAGQDIKKTKDSVVMNLPGVYILKRK